MSYSNDSGSVTRRAALATMGKVAGCGLAAAVLGTGFLMGPSWAATDLGKPQPEETIDQTIKRLFGDTEIQDGQSMIDLKLPVIAENGSVVQARIEAKLPAGDSRHVQDIYIIVDKNRRPMSAHYSFGPSAGGALIGTNLRLGGTTPVRAVIRTSDGKLYQTQREVRVTVGGCGG